MNNLNPTQNIETLKPFPKFCYTIGMIPTSYKASLTYEEQLMWFCNFLENTVIPTVNNNGLAVEELQNLFIQLTNYVDTYFENLDVQEEINNKLDEMAEDGTLASIIAQYLQIASVLVYDTVSDMQNATNLIDGSIAKTLGYYQIGDGGGATYKITDTENLYEHQEELSNDLYATLLHMPKNINMKSVGCKSDDNTFDNSIIINNTITKFGARFTYYFPFGEYYIDNPIVISANYITIKGENERTRFIKTSDNGVDLTIETSKGTTYDLNEYDMCFYVGKATSESNTVSKVKFENLSIQGYDSTDTSYCIVIIGCGYFETENIQLLDYNKGILVDDSFACNFNSVSALTFGSNRNGILAKDSTAIYINNCYLNAGNFSIEANGSRVFVTNTACDGHGYVFYAHDNSYLDMVNCKCETYAAILSADNSSICNISNCDLEGHGSTFSQIVRARESSKVTIKNSNIRYRVYEGDTLPANINGFDSQSNSMVNVEAYFNIQDNIPLVNNNTTGGQYYIVDLHQDGKQYSITAETGITITNSEIFIKDKIVHIYLAGNTTNDISNTGTATKIGTLPSELIHSSFSFRGLCATDDDHIYECNKPAYVGINTSGEISLIASTTGQKYFVISLFYKIK